MHSQQCQKNAIIVDAKEPGEFNMSFVILLVESKACNSIKIATAQVGQMNAVLVNFSIQEVDEVGIVTALSCLDQICTKNQCSG